MDLYNFFKQFLPSARAVRSRSVSCCCCSCCWSFSVDPVDLVDPIDPVDPVDPVDLYFVKEPLERDINIAINGPFWVEVVNPEHPFTVILISRSRGTCLIESFQVVTFLDDLDLLSFLLDSVLS